MRRCGTLCQGKSNIKASVMTQSGGSYNKEPPLFFCAVNKDVLIFFENHEYNDNGTENPKHETVNGGQYGNII